MAFTDLHEIEEMFSSLSGMLPDYASRQKLGLRLKSPQSYDREFESLRRKTEKYRAQVRARAATPEHKAKVREYRKKARRENLEHVRAVDSARRERWRAKPGSKEKEKARRKRWLAKPENVEKYKKSKSSWAKQPLRKEENALKLRIYRAKKKLEEARSDDEAGYLACFLEALQKDWDVLRQKIKDHRDRKSSPVAASSAARPSVVRRSSSAKPPTERAADRCSQ